MGRKLREILATGMTLLRQTSTLLSFVREAFITLWLANRINNDLYALILGLRLNIKYSNVFLIFVAIL
jgi:hypothetical protein